MNNKIDLFTQRLCLTALAATGALVAIGLRAPSARGAQMPQPTTPASTPNPIDDGDVRRALERELMTDHAVPFDAIDVRVDQGVVRLSGSVDNLLASERAVEVAGAVRGVLSVVSTIRVDAPRVPDEELAADVDHALLMDPAAESYEIKVSADDGKITLEGTVQSWAERELAATVAKGVRGVEQLENRLEVEWGQGRSDVEVAAEIRERLRWDVRVDDGLIEVEVDDGLVTLSGTVGSAAERLRARSDAWVAGVTLVDASDLEVDPALRDEMIAYGKHQVAADSEIATAIQRAFAYDPRVLSFEPEVDVENGVVTLTGVVSDRQARRAAERDALATVGVRRVRNLLKVRPAVQRSTAAIEADVRQQLIWDPYVDSSRIGVNVAGNVAYLSGEAASFFERARAEDLASRVRGVVDVRNVLRVEALVQVKPDVEIREEIESELFWSPFVDADQVDVEVVAGRATLTGEVDSFAERRAATENALEGGAVEVDNRLTVSSWGGSAL